MTDDDGGGGCSGESIAILKIWEIRMYAFVIGLPYAREEIFELVIGRWRECLLRLGGVNYMLLPWEKDFMWEELYGVCVSGSSCFWDEIIVASVMFHGGTNIPSVNAMSSKFIPLVRLEVE